MRFFFAVVASLVLAPAQASSVSAWVIGSVIEHPSLFFSYNETFTDDPANTQASVTGFRSDGSASNAASAAADLATGKVGVTFSTVGGLQGDSTSRAQADASIHDEILFNWDDADATKQIPFSIRLTGTSEGVDGIGLGNVHASIGLFYQIFEIVSGASIYDQTFSAIATVQKNQLTEVSLQLALGVASPDGSPRSGDFGDTAAFSWELPDGVSYTSASGVFLTAVPLPAPAWLLFSALSGLAALGRRRSRGQG